MDQPESVLDIVTAIIANSDRPEIRPVILDEAPHEIQARYLSSEKAGRLLGWEPAHTLEDSLAETFAWYKAFLTHES